jgi:TRAP-type C4-dicarboxylate transport system permease small subunit
MSTPSHRADDDPELALAKAASMALTSTLRRLLDRLTTAMMALGEIAVIAMTLLISADIITRYLLNFVLDAGAEIVTHYFMVSIIYFALGDITRNEGNLSATFFTERLSNRNKALLEGVVAIILFLFMMLLTWRTGVSAVDSTRIGEIMQTSRTNLPIWPSRWILPLGCVTMALYSLLIAIDKFTGRLPAKGTERDNILA